MSSAKTLQPSLDPKDYREVRFDDIPATNYKKSTVGMKISVKSSASFLIMPFAKVARAKGVRFRWRVVPGQPYQFNVKDEKHERTKKGDDAHLRVGLMVHGQPSNVPFDWLLPGWIRATKKALQHPSDRLIYLIVGGRSKPGERWESPHHESIEYRAVPSGPADDNGWRAVEVALNPPIALSGLWVMGDGDDTKSKFTVELSSLALP